ncbi:MAG: CTP synthase [Alphaproteobacteria bacterium ADurb.Bin438]|nr:MAG: CTP synthase [Alphaproteobacteria bacterium ADurb.Bin438]
MTKYIFVTGGVVSSLGKGISAATIGALLQARGYKIKIRKLDPYLNIDPGTMSPYQHGEVYVTDDGAETDLDLGHYERFLGIKLSSKDTISGGKIYWDVLNRERRGDYLGATVQMIPHVTDCIKEYIKSGITDEDFVICEIGGTVGDIEGLIFLEAIRQLANEVGRRNSMFVHLTLIPYIEAAHELKTKPSQQAVKSLLEKGIQADLLLCRSSHPISESDRAKLALFCNLNPKNVIPALDLTSIYKVPMAYAKEQVAERIMEHFGLDEKEIVDLSKWEKIEGYLNAYKKEVTIAVVGKYFEVSDAYKSLNEAIFHAGIANNVKVNVKTIDSQKLEEMNGEDIKEAFKDISGILVPGGFGVRGVLGKMKAIEFARENNVPFFGICLGMQLAVIEFARNVLGIKDAFSTEFDENCKPLICLMETYEKDGKVIQRTKDSDKGGTLRLGAYPCVIEKGSLAYKVYGEDKISERHRHRYELDMSYEKDLVAKGMIISGKSPDKVLPEIVEIKDHKFFIGVQFHPEFQSTPFKPHPVFENFIKASIG